MNDPQPSEAAPVPSHPLSAFLLHEGPYLLVLALALFGIAYTSFSRTPMTTYWIVVALLIGMICVLTRWPHLASRDERLRLISTQALHWLAVLVAMHLMVVADVATMMNVDASALAALVLLALGTVTAGIHIMAWRICLVGVIMAAGFQALHGSNNRRFCCSWRAWRWSRSSSCSFGASEREVPGRIEGSMKSPDSVDPYLARECA